MYLICDDEAKRDSDQLLNSSLPCPAAIIENESVILFVYAVYFCRYSKKTSYSTLCM
jgi:hypothetical protein